jgi:hypothetical protein
LFTFLLIARASVGGQLADEASASSKNGATNNKVNSMRVNKITSDSIERPADSDRVVLGDKYSSLNSKYVTQSTVTSGLSSTSKKSKSKPCGPRKNLVKLLPISVNCLN